MYLIYFEKSSVERNSSQVDYLIYMVRSRAKNL